MKPRFVWIIGAIREEYPDVPENLTYKADLVLWDRQEKKVVVTVASGYSNLICLEHMDHGKPFTSLETWINELDNDALASEDIAPTL